MPRKIIGTCQLTGKIGPLVKCHILPQAFTRPTKRGASLLQSTRGRGCKRRWTSWYDNSLVTREGEDFLSAIDDIAIKELRKHKLVWSSWILAPPVFSPIARSMKNHSLRRISDVDQDALALFFVSIAWRASVSKLPDMSDFRLPKSIEEMAKTAIISGKIENCPLTVSLTQLSTIGEAHNHTPILDEKRIIDPEDGSETRVPFARVYLDGLIAHIHLTEFSQRDRSSSSTFLGQAKDLVIPAVTYEASFQYENLLNIAYESYFGPIG